MKPSAHSVDSEWLSRCEDFEQSVRKYKSVRFSHFVSPHEQAVFKTQYRLSPDVKSCAYGGSDDAERVMLAFYPDFMEVQKNDFPVVVLCLSNIGTATHRDVLGSVLGLGIKRETVGDIYFNEDRAFVMCEKNAADYILYNLKTVGRQKVEISVCAEDVALSLRHKFELISVIVSSPRLDAVLAAVCRMSRNDAVKHVASENVNVNFKTECNSDKKLSQGDVISVRHHGRFVVENVLGETRKGRMILEIKKYI